MSALTPPTSGGRTVGGVRSRTRATELSLVLVLGSVSPAGQEEPSDLPNFTVYSLTMVLRSQYEGVRGALTEMFPAFEPQFREALIPHYQLPPPSVFSPLPLLCLLNVLWPQGLRNYYS
jgi:hypothetical protein